MTESCRGTSSEPESIREQDSVAIFDLGPPQGSVANRVEHLGRSSQTDDDGPVIW